MNSDQLTFLEILPVAPIAPASTAKPKPRAARVLVVDDSYKPRKKRPQKPLTPVQQRAKFARERKRRAKLTSEWASCCTYAYNRSPGATAFWQTCHRCKKPLIYSSSLPT